MTSKGMEHRLPRLFDESAIVSWVHFDLAPFAIARLDRCRVTLGDPLSVRPGMLTQDTLDVRL